MRPRNKPLVVTRPSPGNDMTSTGPTIVESEAHEYVGIGQICRYKRCSLKVYNKMIRLPKGNVAFSKNRERGNEWDFFTKTENGRMGLGRQLRNYMDVGEVEEGYEICWPDGRLLGEPDLFVRSNGVRIPVEAKSAIPGNTPRNFDMFQIVGYQLISGTQHGVLWYPRNKGNQIYLVHRDEHPEIEEEILAIRDDILRMRGEENPTDKLPLIIENYPRMCPRCEYLESCSHPYSGPK